MLEEALSSQTPGPQNPHPDSRSGRTRAISYLWLDLGSDSRFWNCLAGFGLVVCFVTLSGGGLLF